MAKVFLSYTIDTRDFVDRIDQALHRGGHSVFVDRGRVSPGSTWADTVRGAISDTDLFVIAASQALPKIDYALNVGVGAAWGLGKPIVAVVFPGVAPETALPLPHSGCKIVSAEGRSDEEIASAILTTIPIQTTTAAS